MGGARGSRCGIGRDRRDATFERTRRAAAEGRLTPFPAPSCLVFPRHHVLQSPGHQSVAPCSTRLLARMTHVTSFERSIDEDLRFTLCSRHRRGVGIRKRQANPTRGSRGCILYAPRREDAFRSDNEHLAEPHESVALSRASRASVPGPRDRRKRTTAMKTNSTIPSIMPLPYSAARGGIAGGSCASSGAHLTA